MENKNNLRFRSSTNLPFVELYRFGESEHEAVEALRVALTNRKIDPNTKTITVVDQRTGEAVRVVRGEG